MAGRLQLAARSQANLIIGGLWHTLYPIFLLFLDQPPNTIGPSWSIKTPLPGHSHPHPIAILQFVIIVQHVFNNEQGHPRSTRSGGVDTLDSCPRVDVVDTG